jgi:hypothetical protein
MPIPAGNTGNTPAPIGSTYATLEQLKVRVGAIDEAEDPALTSALETASRGIEAFCGRQFNRDDTATPRLFHPDAHLALVDDFHTTDGLIIETDAGRDGTFATVWEARDYQLEPLNGIVDGQPGWPWWKIRPVGRHRFPLCRTASPQTLLRVTARWGWASIPAPVVESCLIIAAECWKLKDAPLGVAGVAEFGVLRVRDNPMVGTKLGPYRRDALLVA